MPGLMQRAKNGRAQIILVASCQANIADRPASAEWMRSGILPSALHVKSDRSNEHFGKSLLKTLVPASIKEVVARPQPSIADLFHQCHERTFQRFKHFRAIRRSCSFLIEID